MGQRISVYWQPSGQEAGVTRTGTAGCEHADNSMTDIMHV